MFLIFRLEDDHSQSTLDNAGKQLIAFPCRIISKTNGLKILLP